MFGLEHLESSLKGSRVLVELLLGDVSYVLRRVFITLVLNGNVPYSDDYRLLFPFVW